MRKGIFASRSGISVTNPNGCQLIRLFDVLIVAWNVI